MRLLQTLAYHFTADVFDFTTDDQSNRTYAPAGQMTIGLSGDPLRGLQIWTKTQLKAGQRLANIRDRDGLMVHPSTINPDLGITYEVVTTVPVINTWGQRELFQSTCRPI